MAEYKNLFESCDAYIRAGRSDLAAKSLHSLTAANIPREHRKSFANLCRRAGLLELGLRILTPVVRGEKVSTLKPTADELSEYAVLLQRCGATQEARQILEKLNPNDAPESLLYRAFCHFSRWEYAESVPLLKAFLELETSPYQKLVGQVNLADAFISLDRFDEAQDLLNLTLEAARQAKTTRLAGNCLEMLAQIGLLSGSLDAAECHLNAAFNALEFARTTDQLHLKRWQSVLRALRSNSIAPLKEFRQEALERMHYESVRVADFYAQKITYSKNEFEYLYFGTPYKPFRERISRQLARAPEGKDYIFGTADARCFSLETGRLDLVESGIEGTKLHVVLNTLLRDFYQPVLVASLFAQLFPTEHFNIFTSPNRVHQTLRRTRRWLEENEIPVALQLSGRGYVAHIHGDFGFTIPIDQVDVDHRQLAKNTLQARFPGDIRFTASEAREALGYSSTALRRFIDWALEANVLEKFGASTSTVYYFKTSTTNHKDAA